MTLIRSLFTLVNANTHTPLQNYVCVRESESESVREREEGEERVRAERDSARARGREEGRKGGVGGRETKSVKRDLL